jgi:anti-sigma28 factor (negative regulator of flagellin synthesis)
MRQQSSFTSAATCQEKELRLKIKRLRALIRTGAYRIPAKKIAEAMLKEHRLREV